MINQLLGEYYWNNLSERIDELFGSRQTIEAHVSRKGWISLGSTFRLSSRKQLMSYVTLTKEEVMELITRDMDVTVRELKQGSYLFSRGPEDDAANISPALREEINQKICLKMNETLDVDKIFQAFNIMINREMFSKIDLEKSATDCLDVLNG